MRCKKRQTWYLLVWLVDAQDWHIVVLPQSEMEILGRLG
jgi:hypothetical protein